MFTSMICKEANTVETDIPPSWIIFKLTELLTFVYTDTGCLMMDTGCHTLCLQNYNAYSTAELIYILAHLCAVLIPSAIFPPEC